MPYMLSVVNSDVLVTAIEAEIARLGRNITNVEINELVNKLVAGGKGEVVAVTKEPLDMDVLGGNLREKGVKVRNISEEIRRKEQETK